MMWVIADWYLKLVGVGVAVFLVWSVVNGKQKTENGKRRKE